MAGFRWFKVLSVWLQVAPRFSKYGAATTFLVSQMKKNLSKTTNIKLYPEKKGEENIRQKQCIKK